MKLHFIIKEKSQLSLMLSKRWEGYLTLHSNLQGILFTLKFESKSTIDDTIVLLGKTIRAEETLWLNSILALYLTPFKSHTGLSLDNSRSKRKAWMEDKEFLAELPLCQTQLRIVFLLFLFIYLFIYFCFGLNRWETAESWLDSSIFPILNAEINCMHVKDYLVLW